MLPYYRITSARQARLIEEMEQMKIYDCHEHLPPEEQRLQGKPDAFTLFSHYCKLDLCNAGMDPAVLEKVLWEDCALDWKWQVFAPYYERCKHTPYFRAAHIALKHFYGEDELTKQNYRAVSERIAKANTKGLYARVLRDACGIICSLNCDGPLENTNGGLLHQCVRAREFANRQDVLSFLHLETAEQVTLEQLEDALASFVANAAKQGAYGVKFMPVPFLFPQRAEVEQVLRQICSEGKEQPRANPLNDYLMLCQMRLAQKHGLVNMIHTGYWNDYREMAPANLLPVIMQNPDMRFDVYHVGYPNVREAIMLGKAWPNVRLNMAWTYIISQHFAYDALSEMVEMLPDNKIFGFGGDYYVIEKVFGHLCMARETIAAVLADKIARHELTAERALRMAEKMLYDNPKEFYGL